MSTGQDTTFRRNVLIVSVLNLSYFGIEFAVAQLIGSVSLFADSVDFLEDASINLLIFVAGAWSARARSYVGTALALVILVPAVAALSTAIVKIANPQPPEVVPLTVTALGALAVNLTCAIILSRHRARTGSLARAAWLSARNDALANVAIILAALLTLVLASGWPDTIVGVGIALLNFGAARAVWKAAREERTPPRA